MTNDTNPSCVTQEWALRQLVTTMVRTREKKVELDNRSPPFLVWKGGCGAAGKVVQSYKAHMRQTEVISSGQTAPSIQVGLFKPSRAWEGGAGGEKSVLFPEILKFNENLIK